MHVRVKKRMPLGEFLKGDWMGAITSDQVIPTLKRHTDHVTSVKPERRLGAGWLDSLVSNRRQFALCDDCYRKYVRQERWWITNEYVPIFNPRSLTDCDGCSRFVWSTKMVPAEAPQQNAHIDRTEGSRIYVCKR